MTLVHGINHVAIMTADLERFIDFYVNVFEVELTGTRRVSRAASCACRCECFATFSGELIELPLTAAHMARCV